MHNSGMKDNGGGSGTGSGSAPQGDESARGAYIASALIQAAAELEHRLQAALARFDLSVAKYGVLRALASAGRPLALSDLAARLTCVRSNITQLVDRLEAEGLVKRVDDPEDRRSVRAELTEKGHRLEREGTEAVRTVHMDVASRVPEAGVPDLLRALSALG